MTWRAGCVTFTLRGFRTMSILEGVAIPDGARELAAKRCAHDMWEATCMHASSEHRAHCYSNRRGDNESRKPKGRGAERLFWVWSASTA